MVGGKGLLGLVLVLLQLQLWTPALGRKIEGLTSTDKDLTAFALNLEYFEAEFFLFGALGYGLDKQAPYLADGGPAPYGGQKADLDPVVQDLVLQMGLQEVGHVRVIKESVEDAGFPRVQLNISKQTWATVMNSAFNTTLTPPFDPYNNSVNYMLASYAIPYVGLTGYVGANSLLESPGGKRLVAGLLGVESGQDALIRTWLYERKDQRVQPYDFTIADATVQISKLRNDLGFAANESVTKGPLQFVSVDEGLVVPKWKGAEQQVTGNVLVGDLDSLAYPRTPEQILGIVYGSGDPRRPGAFYPQGARGRIAESYHSYSGHAPSTSPVGGL